MPRRPVVVAVLLGVAGAVVATVLGFLTFGAQATVTPDHLPVAVSAPSEGPLRTAAEHVAEQGGDAVAWQVTDPEEGRRLLADKEVYGVLELAPDGLTVVVSGAINPQGTQVTQQILTGAANGVAAALPQPVGPPTVETIYPATTAGRTAPIAVSALLWIGGLVAAIGFGVLTVRQGIKIGAGARLTLLVTVSVLATAVVIGFLRLWDSSLPLDAEIVGFLLLTAVAFASVQGALLRLLHLRAAAILGPLYLIAPTVANQVPEMLNPAYRALLWSWTPFRFPTEGLRSLLQGTPDAPDVGTAVLVLASMAAVGLVVMLWPAKKAPEPVVAEPAPVLSRSGS